VFQSLVPSAKRPLFQNAAELVKGGAVTIYAEPLCSLTGPIERGSLTLLFGDPVCNAIAQSLCLAAQRPYIEGGLESKSLVIDAGNAVDPYMLAKLATDAGIDPKVFLRGVKLSRAFNCYQLAELVVEELPRAANETHAGLVALLDPSACFTESEVKPAGTEALVSAILRSLLGVARKNGVVAVVSCPSTDSVLTRFLDQARVAVCFERMESRQEIRATLARHPYAIRKSMTLPLHHDGPSARISRRHGGR
jgi:hypothetical protein